MTILNEHVISHAYGLPKEKEMVGQSTVSASGFDIDRGTWFVILNGTVQKKDIKQSVQSILGKSKYFSSQGRVYEVTTDSKYGAEVVKTNPSGQVQTVISGGVTSQRVRKNPVSVSEFRSEMTDMLVKDPRRDFKVIDAPKPFGGPAFRDVLYTFVTYRGESYGWTKDGKIYHRRGSLIMPKLKVNRAVEGAKMFYHTHPSKDEPSLSSADDYQFYYDLAFAFGIKHFYTIMENRLDHFEITVKKAKEEDYLKMDEDKVLADINGIIDSSESETTKKHKSSKTMTDETFYAKMTKDTVTRLNRRFGDFATIKYKGHANPKIVRENPSDAGFLRNPPIRISHIHKASQLEELRDTTNNFEHYGANEYGHSQYVYWWVDHHFSSTNIHPQGRLYKLKEMGLSDDARRKLRAYMNEEIAPGYSKLDILLLLALYHDVGKKREKEQGIHHSIIASNMFQEEIGPELNLPQEVTDICALLMLTDCGRKNTTPESFRAQAGDYLAVAYALQIADMLAHHPFMFTSLASEAKEEGRLDHANVEQYKVMVAKELFSKIEEFLNNTPRTNPPPTAKSIIYSGSYDTPIDGDIAEISLGESFKRTYKAQLFLNDAESNTSPNIGLSGGSFRVTMSKAKGHFTEEDPFGADLAVSLYEKYGRILSEFTPGLSFAEVPEPAIMVNPRHAKNLQVVAVAGPSLSGKESVIDELASMLDGAVIPTVTTRPKRKHEGRSTDRVFVSETKFKEMIGNGDFVEWNKSSNGYMYGRRYSDFKKPIAVVDSNLRNVVKYQEAFPNTTSVFLDIDMTPAQLSKKLRSKTAITEKQVKAKADMILKQIAEAQHIPFDKVIKSKGDKPNAIAKQISNDIEKQNPPTDYGLTLRYQLLLGGNPDVPHPPTLDNFMPKQVLRRKNALEAVKVVHRDNDWLVIRIESEGPLASYAHMFRDQKLNLSIQDPGWETTLERRQRHGSGLSYKPDFPIYFIAKADMTGVWPTDDQFADGYAILGPRTKNHYPVGEFRNSRNAEVGIKGGHMNNVGRNVPPRLYQILLKIAQQYGDQELTKHVNHLKAETPEFRKANHMNNEGYVRVPGQQFEGRVDDKISEQTYATKEDYDKARELHWKEEAERRQELAKQLELKEQELAREAEKRNAREKEIRAAYHRQFEGMTPAERSKQIRRESFEQFRARREPFSPFGPRKNPPELLPVYHCSVCDVKAMTHTDWYCKEHGEVKHNPPVSHYLNEVDRHYIEYVKSNMRQVSPVVLNRIERNGKITDRYMAVFEFPVVEKQDRKVKKVGTIRALFYSRSGTGSESQGREYAEALFNLTDYTFDRRAEGGTQRMTKYDVLAEAPFLHNIAWKKWGDARGRDFSPVMWLSMLGYQRDPSWYIKPKYSQFFDLFKRDEPRTTPPFPSRQNEEKFQHRWGHRSMFYAGVALSELIPEPASLWKGQFLPREEINSFMRKHGAILRNDVKDNPKSREEWFMDWAKLINMKNKELETFLTSSLGKKAGLSASEAKEQGINSGRVSGRAILRMRKKIGLGGPKDYVKGPTHASALFILAQKKWNDLDWEWCSRQVRFNKRFMGDWMGKRKGPLVRKGQPTRRLLALWVWGLDPWRYARKVEKRKTMPKCPKVPWIGMTEKRMYGVQSDEVRMNPPSKSIRLVDLVSRMDMKAMVRNITRRMEGKTGIPGQPAKGKFTLEEKQKKQKKAYAKFLKDQFGYTGSSPVNALEAIFASHLKKFKKDKLTLYRAIITVNDEVALAETWDKYGVFESWGTQKHNADIYSAGSNVVKLMNSGNQALIEGEIYFGDVNWNQTIHNNFVFGKSEDEINPDPDTTIFVKKVSFYKLDDKARKKYADAVTGIGLNWKPWIDPSFKPVNVWEPKEHFPIYGPHYNDLYGPAKANPQTGLPGIGDPPVDPATIQPHLDWPQWSPPTWLPKNMIPASAVFSPAVKTTLRGKKVTRPSFYYIQQSDLNHLIQSQQYLELQEAERQKKIREARELKEQLARDGQKFVEDFRTNPVPEFKFPRHSYIYYNNDTPKRFGDNVLIEKDDRFQVLRRLTDNEGNHLYQLHPDRAFNVKKNIKLGKNYVEENFIMAPDMASSMLPEHLMNPPNIPFPIPEEYQEELERRLSEEMTSEGYRPHTIPEVIEEGLYDDSPSDFSYAQGEYEEFLEEIEKGDLDEAYAEYSDVEGHVAYWLWTNHRIQVPIYTGYHVEKTRERIKIFNHLFNQYGLKFGPEYLKGGSNYEKVHKVRNALDAAANDQRKSRTTDTDEEMAQKVAASVASIVGSRKMETNESANDIQSDFEWMIDNAYEGRLIEMEPGSTYNGRVWWNEQKPWIKEKYGMAPLEGASWLTPIYDENFDPDNEEGEFNEDGTAAPLHFLNQLMRIPLQKEPNAVRILQVALNIGQGLANGSVDHRYEFEDFIAYDNPSDFNQFRKEQREKRAQDKANRQQEREVRQRDRVERLQASEERMRELESQRIARLQAAEARIQAAEERMRDNPRKITPSYVRSHPNTLFVFGDNDQRKGKGGQAVIRDEPNAIGLRTKKAPRTSASAYYVDAEYQENISKMKSDLKEISRRSVDYDKVYFIPGIGEGLAKLKEKAPRTYAWMKKNKPSNNPMAPGYQSYGWTTQDWRSIKVNNKGDIDYSEKCGAEGTKTPSGSPRLCLPAAVVRSLMRTESGKDVIRNQARKKARAKKGERVPWHPRIKKIWKRIEDKTVKDK